MRHRPGPSKRKIFIDDILTVLAQVHELIARDYTIQWVQLHGFLPPLLTIIKLFDGGLIRKKATEIGSTLYIVAYNQAPIFTLTLESDHDLVKSTTATLVDEEQRALWNTLLDSQLPFNRKVYALAHLPSLDPTNYFLFIFNSSCLTVITTNEGTLEWESRQASKKDLIELDNQRKTESTQHFTSFWQSL